MNASDPEKAGSPDCDRERRVKVFRYLPDADCFVIEPEYQPLCDELGLTEWHAAVWIGRLFILDQDYGEHWFDNWEEREPLRGHPAVKDESELMVVVPERFAATGGDGPCHSPELRKRFWTDVLRSLEVSLETLFLAAREEQEGFPEWMRTEEHGWVADLEERIKVVRSSRAGSAG